MEALLVAVETVAADFCLCSIYRHPQSTRSQFRAAIADIFESLPINSPAILVGDLNDDQSAQNRESSWIVDVLKDCGFVDEVIPSPTTDFGSTLDRVFCRNISISSLAVTDCPFSDHDCLAFSVRV